MSYIHCNEYSMRMFAVVCPLHSSLRVWKVYTITLYHTVCLMGCLVSTAKRGCNCFMLSKHVNFCHQQS